MFEPRIPLIYLLYIQYRLNIAVEKLSIDRSIIIFIAVATVHLSAELLVSVLSFHGLLAATILLHLFVSCSFGLLVEVFGWVAVGAENLEYCDLGDASFALLLFKSDQMRVTVCLNKCQNLVIGHLETGIVVVSEFKRVIAALFKRLVNGVEDEDVARHFSIHIATKNDNF